MNKNILFLFFSVALVGCNFDKKQITTSRGFAKDERRYNLECIDETLNDTIVAISIDLVTSTARIKYSSSASIGFSVELMDSEFISIYSIQYYKLKKPLGGNYTIELDSGKYHFPISLKNNITDQLVNTSVQFVKVKEGVQITDELVGAEALRKTLFEFDHFPELEGHRYIITESYQDSKKSEVVTIIQNP